MKRCTLLLVASFAVVAALFVDAQDEVAPTGPQPVIIQRRAVQLSLADRYRVPLQLRPVREVVITAPFDGVVKRVAVKTGASAEAQAELVSVDNQRLKLMQARAIAARELAELRLRQATVAGDKDAVAVAEAEVKVADAEVRIADYDSQQTSLRAPYGGTVLDVYVQKGQRVRKGDRIASFGDLSQLRCRVPVDRATSQVGASVDLNVEAQPTTGRIEAIVALSMELQVLRELSLSVALADVVIDNPSRTLRDGQAVFAPMVPKHPVTRVPLDVVKTAGSGERVVQVLREDIVRNIPVTLHGQDGITDVFVSGPFTEHDELLLSVSVELADGTAVRPSSADRFAATGTGGTTTTSGAGKQPPIKKKKTGAAGF